MLMSCNQPWAWQINLKMLIRMCHLGFSQNKEPHDEDGIFLPAEPPLSSVLLMTWAGSKKDTTLEQLCVSYHVWWNRTAHCCFPSSWLYFSTFPLAALEVFQEIPAVPWGRQAWNLAAPGCNHYPYDGWERLPWERNAGLREGAFSSRDFSRLHNKHFLLSKPGSFEERTPCDLIFHHLCCTKPSAFFKASKLFWSRCSRHLYVYFFAGVPGGVLVFN